MQNHYIAPILLLSVMSCHSPQPQVTLRDSQGNYATTADFHSMQRADFVSAIEAGIADYDGQLRELRTRANTLGGDALKEFADCERKLQVKRKDVVNQLAIAQNSLDDMWPEERKETVEAYTKLRDAFTEAQNDVLDA
ncbi:MAG: hypothetical protein R3F49_10305 [Planctomycetota bacterium]